MQNHAPPPRRPITRTRNRRGGHLSAKLQNRTYSNPHNPRGMNPWDMSDNVSTLLDPNMKGTRRCRNGRAPRVHVHHRCRKGHLGRASHGFFPISDCRSPPRFMYRHRGEDPINMLYSTGHIAQSINNLLKARKRCVRCCIWYHSQIHLDSSPMRPKSKHALTWIGHAHTRCQNISTCSRTYALWPMPDMGRI